LNLGEKPGFQPVFPRVCPKPTGFWNKLRSLFGFGTVEFGIAAPRYQAGKYFCIMEPIPKPG
jgi:hypothetical protein